MALRCSSALQVYSMGCFSSSLFVDATRIWLHDGAGATLSSHSWTSVELRGSGCIPPTVTRARRQDKGFAMGNRDSRGAGFVTSNASRSYEILTSRDGASDDVSSSSSITMQQLETLQQLRRAGVIACLRTQSPELALDAARAALDGGLTVVEVTMTTPSAAQVIEALVREYPSAQIGAGTVLSMQEADRAGDAGAKFLTSPATVKEIVCTHKHGPLVCIPGAMTPTEVLSAYNLGAPAIKLYPVTLLGGTNFVLAVGRSLPHIPLIVSQGVTLDMVESYITAGALGVILSDAIFDKSAMDSKDFSRIRFLASAAASKAASCSLESSVIPI